MVTSKIKTQILKCSSGKLSGNDTAQIRAVFQKGGVAIFPTDTVYGMGCNAFNIDSIHRIYQLKGRNYSKPLPLLLGSSLQLDLVAKEIPREAEPLMAAFWPGALTFVFKTAPMALAAVRGKSTVAVRVPDNALTRKIVESGSTPLATTSANASGKPALVSGADVIREFSGKVDLIVDGGVCREGVASTVIDATYFPFTVLREGALSKSRLLSILAGQDSNT